MENTVLFIKQNREAFPRKRLLNIEFGNNWDIPKWTSSIGNLTNLEVALAKIKSRRDKTFEHMKPAIAIYEAAGDLLKEIHITNIPYFYEQANGIKANHLMLITDLDEDRIDQGEGPSMEVFLKRCPCVSALRIGAGSPNMLSWAANEALSASDLEKIGSIKLSNNEERQSQQKPQVRIAQRSTKILGSLETLKVSSSRPYRFGLQIVNDISIASSASLQEIRLAVNHDNSSSSEVPTAVKRQHIKKSFQLHDVPSANGIGSWPLLLPHLRSVHVILTHVASIQIGSFDQSPNLEVLEIRFGGIPLPESRPSDDEELPLPESDEYLDRRWQQARIDSRLFPIWNLPKLKTLILYDSAASRFDFASLPSMENLEKLDLGFSELAPLIGVDEYKRVQFMIWKERLESALDKETGRLNSLDAVKPWMWPLPKLKFLNMDGPPATMFSLDWLLVCPKLESFGLGEPMGPRVIGSVPFFAKGFVTRDSKGDNGNDRYKPYMDSQISSVELKPGWRMSSEDLKRLLTIYTPFICSLSVDRIDDDWDGYSFVKAIKDADSINCGNAMYERERRTESRGCVAQAGGTQESNLERPGEDLNRVDSGYSYSNTELRKLNLVKINPREEVKYEDKNLRVYSMLTQVLVDQFDFYAVSNEGGSEDEYDGYGY
ncbi:hypothetical protein BGZ79_009592 [Entomortierella chlamydospora]|nr:hypothetical protein BGZ79_009592 [Entomortierella chlamydospora]